MLFTSWSFLVFFLATLTGLRIIPSRKVRLWFLLLASMFFYGYWKVSYLVIIIVPAVADYILGIRIEESSNNNERRWWLIASIVLNLGLLAYFKYANFFLLSFADLAGVQSRTMEILLPLGISFFTFKSLSYTIDIYRRKIAACRELWRYALFVMFFPEMIAGPIVRASFFLPQTDRALSWHWGRVAAGAQQIVFGLTKKMVLADRLAIFVDPIFAAPLDYSPGAVTVAVIAYAFQIYTDFSGYSDIAIGVARIIGFDLPENFNMPYLATSFSDFWRRWHITLSQWLRDYLYIPLGGNRRGKARVILNLLITMLLGGLWHGADWRFVFWGFLHGTYLITEKLLQKGAPSSLATKLAGWMLTFVGVNFAWIFFRAPDFRTGWIIVLKVLRLLPDGYQWFYYPAYAAIGALVVGHALGIWISAPQAPGKSVKSVLFARPTGIQENYLPGTTPVLRSGFFGALVGTIWLLTLFLTAVVKGNPFIYFQF